jgi:hypothetical protein
LFSLLYLSWPSLTFSYFSCHINYLFIPGFAKSYFFLVSFRFSPLDVFFVSFLSFFRFVLFRFVFQILFFFVSFRFCFFSFCFVSFFKSGFFFDSFLKFFRFISFLFFPLRSVLFRFSNSIFFFVSFLGLWFFFVLFLNFFLFVSFCSVFQTLINTETMRKTVNSNKTQFKSNFVRYPFNLRLFGLVTSSYCPSNLFKSLVCLVFKIQSLH